MDAPLLTPDFEEFSRLLDANRVDYLLVDGDAVGFHGYPRATVDLDVWVRATPDNAARILDSLREFGVISLADLEINTRAAGRHKDLADLENLP